MNFLKGLIPLKIKKYLFKQILYIHGKKKEYEFKIYLKSIMKQKKIVLLDAADYGNLGDQAILMAELKFLKDHFSTYQIIKVGIGNFNKYAKIVEKYIGIEDVIILQGGGNFGNEYKRAENTRRAIINSFPNNKILLFPQTMYFTINEEGKRELSESLGIYTKHKDLILIAREKTSYELMKESFVHNTVLLTPDIVLYLNKTFPQAVRKGALFCCRNDIEGLFSEKEKSQMLHHLKVHFNSIVITDTVGENSFDGVEKKFDEFRKAEIVVTDRLHGMVFSAITGTPCIALSNYNYKVSGTYDWIKHLDYVKFASNINQIPDLIAELIPLKNTKYDNEFALPYYKQIIEIFNGENDVKELDSLEII